MASIFSDVQSQGFSRNNHHALPLGGDADTGGELSKGLSVPLTAVLGLCRQLEHPLEVGEVLSSQVRLWLRKLVGSCWPGESDGCERVLGVR